MYEMHRVPITSSWQSKCPLRGYTFALQSMRSVRGAHPVIFWTISRNSGE